jgi:hypothetical protein
MKCSFCNIEVRAELKQCPLLIPTDHRCCTSQTWRPEKPAEIKQPIPSDHFKNLTLSESPTLDIHPNYIVRAISFFRNKFSKN